MARLAIRLALAIGSLLLVQPAAAQPFLQPVESTYSSPLLTTNPTLRASLDRIAKGSALWRDALESVRLTARYAVILTSDQVLVADAPGAHASDAFDPTILAEVAPVLRENGKLQVVLVVVNLALLEETHRSERSLPWEFEADLDRILVHEIYGHAVPYLLAGHVSGKCPDPLPDQRAADACSIRRENAVRAELGLGRRTDYGLDGLALTRRNRH